MASVIEFHHVSKAYDIGQTQTSLREAIVDLSRRLAPFHQSRPNDRTFWALRDVTFQVLPGDILGIIGHNGAGKSTALKLLSRVTFPTSGTIVTRGRLAALIELGAGFHPDLTGRENIFLNGAIVGLKTREIRAEFHDIVAFAGLEQFIDTPVKRYSSGMYVRLAFAVAAHVKADLLLIDEVLSVGDTAFQQKCLDKMRDLHRSGTTIVFVSHSMWTVQTFCNRAILLKKGAVEAVGRPEDVIDIYRRYEREDLLAQHGAGANDENHRKNHSDAAITQIEIADEGREARSSFPFYARVLVRVHYTAPFRIQSPVFLVRIRRADGLICCAVSNNREPGFAQGHIKGDGVFEVLIGPLPLVPDVYSVEALVVDRERPIVYAHRGGENFRIQGELSGAEAGVFAPNAEWLADGAKP